MLNRRDLLGSLLLVALGLAVYKDASGGPFLLDDYGAIVENATLHDLTNLRAIASPPRDTTVAGRPILNLSFALNFAWSGREAWSYKVTNVGIHVLAALALLGFLRRALTRGGAHRGMALPIAMLWTLHPLQTQAVTYSVQRAESLMGLLYLSTMYCAARGMDSGRRRWFAAAVLVCALGMGTKEVMVSAPIMVLLYDRVFVQARFRDAVRKRWPLYLGLAATWIPLAALVATNARGQSVGFGFEQASPIWYLMTQTGVVLHYLRLAVFPHPLVFDYAWPIAHQLRDVAGSVALVSLLLTTTLVCLCRRNWIGFLGCWFFLILAPTSSVLPILTEVAAEHRMYLPLAAPLTLLVIGAHALIKRSALRPVVGRALGVGLLGTAVALLGWQTTRRNLTYASEIEIWEDVIRKQPRNGRAHNSLAVHLMRGGRLEEAYRSASRAFQAGEALADVRYNLGTILLRLGRPDEAVGHFESVLSADPDDCNARAHLGSALAASGRPKEARPHLMQALADCNPPGIYGDLGEVLSLLGEREQALDFLERACELQPDSASRHLRFAIELEAAGKIQPAIAAYREAHRLDARLPAAVRLAQILATCEDASVRDGAQALRLAEARLESVARPTVRLLEACAAAYAETRRFDEALRSARQALALATEKGQAASIQRLEECIALYERGQPLRIAPR